MSVIVDWQCIEAMAQSYRQRAVRANESGHANYTSIRSGYSMVSNDFHVRNSANFKKK